MDDVQVPTTFSDLPAVLAAQVLASVPQQQRLTQCALACRAWSSAAASVTVHVQCMLTAATVPAFQTWLLQHAGQLRALQLSPGGPCSCWQEAQAERPSLVLPLGKLEQLQQLELRKLDLQLPGEDVSSIGQQPTSPSPAVSNQDSVATAGVSLRSLQHLQLSDVKLVDTSSLLQLTHAPQLTSLIIEDLEYARFPWASAAEQRIAAALSAMLQRLPRLSVLELPYSRLSNAALQHLAAMSGLVSLSRVRCAPECDLRHLPPSITQLLLLPCGWQGSVSQQLAALCDRTKSSS